MKLVPGFRYSSVAAPNSTGNDLGERLTVDGSPRIPRRPAGVKLRRGVTYGAGLRLALHTPAVAGRRPLPSSVPLSISVTCLPMEHLLPAATQCY